MVGQAMVVLPNTVKCREVLKAHIETMACAFAKKFNVEPDEAVLCHQITNDGIERIWLERRKPDTRPTIRGDQTYCECCGQILGIVG